MSLQMKANRNLSSKFIYLGTITVLLNCSGCAINQLKSDAFVTAHPRFPQNPVRAVLLYIPNRLVDVLDVVHFGYGVGPGFGFEIHPTRFARLGAVDSIDVGFAWLGRFGNPVQQGLHARATISVLEAKYVPRWSKVWRFPQWDVGIYYHALFDQIYIAIAPDEIVDLIVGFSTFDLKGDDW